MKITRSYICGVTCTVGSPHCNGYCSDGRIPAPGTYEIETLNFGDALKAVKAGQRITRLSWQGKDMFVYLVPAASYVPHTPVARAHFGGQSVPYNAYFALKGADDTVSPWQPSGNDALADDWHVVPQ